MRRALVKLLPEDHRSVEKQSCKRQDNNGRPKYQNVCISFWSAAFVFDSVLAIERAVYCRSGWVVLSCLGGPFICHSIIRKWQREVFGHLAASGEGGQLREPSDDKRSVFYIESGMFRFYLDRGVRPGYMFT
jgi:hypothetical protein